MHIGTGIYEGKEIKDSRESQTFTSRGLTIKEEVFTIFGTRVLEATVLDINDSNGMYGIEALSRGATCCRFVNPRKEESDLTAENLKIIGIDPTDMAITDTPENFLKNPIIGECGHEYYDVIFFEIRDKNEMNLIEPVLERQKAAGVTAVIHPQMADFVFPSNIDGHEIVETRDFDEKRIVILLKTSA
jgi:16S rRNA G966 N2-methylase RsmD